MVPVAAGRRHLGLVADCRQGSLHVGDINRGSAGRSSFGTGRRSTGPSVRASAGGDPCAGELPDAVGGHAGELNFVDPARSSYFISEEKQIL